MWVYKLRNAAQDSPRKPLGPILSAIALQQKIIF
jgi:hypothetical protein